MKKINPIIFIVIVFIIGCSSKKNKDLNQLIEMIPKENLSQILDSFVNESLNNESDCYEMYIDKIYPDKYLTLLYYGNHSLIEQEKLKPIMYTMISNVKFDIYSGVEKYFRIDDNEIVNTLNPDYSNIDSKIWLLKDNANKVTVTDFHSAYPFMPILKESDDFYNISRP